MDKAREVPDSHDSAWFGITFVDVDCRHWLPFLTAETLGQESPKLTIRQASEPYATDWALPPENKEVA